MMGKVVNVFYGLHKASGKKPGRTAFWWLALVGALLEDAARLVKDFVWCVRGRSDISGAPAERAGSGAEK